RQPEAGVAPPEPEPRPAPGRGHDVSAPVSRARRGGNRREAVPDEISTVFPSVAPSAAGARRVVGAALRRGDCQNDFVELGLLLTSGLGTNPHPHARPETRVSVRLDDGCVRIEVRDVGGGEPELRPLDTDRVDGRGLQIVDAIADRWGYDTSPDGTSVWFELARQP